MVWNNADGLTIRYHREEGQINTGGRVTYADGVSNVIEWDISSAGFNGTTGTQYDTPSNVFVPAGHLITRAYLVVTTAFTSGGAATLDIGLQRQDGTEIDNDGIDAAVALTALNTAGKQVENDGALVKGTALAYDGYLYVKAGTAAFTAGKAKLVVEYTRPAAV